MEYIAFYVGKRPVVYWDPDLTEKNREFLQGIDGRYYQYMAETHASALDGESRFQAATALRIAYSQGLETLFALLCALLQAPACMVGWMQSYRTADLCEMVEAVSTRKPVHVIPAFRPATWDHIATTVHSQADIDDERVQQMVKGYARLWSRFARDFLDERTRQEYNALKHGSRPRPGGFKLSMGPQPAVGVPPTPESMVSLGGSEFGSSFFVAERLSGQLHLRPNRVSINWIPQNLIDGLAALAMSIGNIVAYARHGNGDLDDSLGFTMPEDAGDFDLPWAAHPGVLSGSLDTRFGIESIQPWSRKEVEAILERDQEVSG